MQPLAKFSHGEVIAIAGTKMIVDGILQQIYDDKPIPPLVREVGLALAYLIGKYPDCNGAIPHWLLRRTVKEHIEDVGLESVDDLIKQAIKLNMILLLSQDIDKRYVLYGFTEKMKKRIVEASKAEAMAYVLAMEQAKNATDPKHGYNEKSNSKYYRNILVRLLNKSGEDYEEIMRRLQNMKHIYKHISPVFVMSFSSGLLWLLQMVSSWSTGTT